jgi:hypothetical protein
VKLILGFFAIELVRANTAIIAISVSLLIQQRRNSVAFMASLGIVFWSAASFGIAGNLRKKGQPRCRIRPLCFSFETL